MSRKRSLAKELSFSIVLMAAPIFVLALGALFLQSRYYIRQEASERANSMLNLAMQRARNYMSTIETSADANTWLLEENFTPDTLQAVSYRIVNLNRHVHSCSISAEPDVFPQYGRYFSVYSAHTTSRGIDTVVTIREPDYEYFVRHWYKTPLETGKSCWLDPFCDHTEGAEISGDAIASYAKPLRKQDGKIVGIISTNLSFSRLAEAINVVRFAYSDSYFVLLDSDGRYLIHPDSTRIFRKTIFSDTDPAQDPERIALGHEMTAGKQGSMHVKENGRLYHACYSPVPGTDWSLALLCPEREILRSYHRLTYIIVVIILIGLLIIQWLCNRSVSHSISPLNQLLKQSECISEGHYDEKIQYSQREDEIGQLQNSFAMMQQSLQDHVGSIRKTTENAKRRNEELMHAMGLAEESVRQKTEFVRNVSHQIRTPLNIILGFAQVLRNSNMPQKGAVNAQSDLQEENLKEITSMMKYNAAHLKRMVLMLFDSSETGNTVEMLRQRKEEVSCNEIANKCIATTKEQFPDCAIRLETEVPDSLCVMTIPLYLTRTILELLYNAAKYSDGQHVTVRVSQTNTTVRFSVEDKGTGLPEGKEEMIFKPFTKVDDLSEGLGLGLSLSKRHAKSLGGDLFLDTSYKNGCRFIVEIPKTR